MLSLEIPAFGFVKMERVWAQLSKDETYATLLTNGMYSFFSRGDEVLIDAYGKDYKYNGLKLAVGETYHLFSPNFTAAVCEDLIKKCLNALECFGITKGLNSNTYWAFTSPIGANIAEAREELFKIGFVSPQMAEDMDQVTFMRHKKLASQIIEKYKLNVIKERMYGYKAAKNKRVHAL